MEESIKTKTVTHKQVNELLKGKMVAEIRFQDFSSGVNNAVITQIVFSDNSSISFSANQDFDMINPIADGITTENNDAIEIIFDDNT